MKAELIITIPIRYIDTCIDYGEKSSIIQHRFNSIKTFIKRIFKVSETDISAQIRYIPLKDEICAEICKTVNKKLSIQDNGGDGGGG